MSDVAINKHVPFICNYWNNVNINMTKSRKSDRPA